MTVRRKRSRAGFTLVEIAVASVILAMLAAVTAPYLVSYLDEQRAETTATELQDLSDGIAAYAEGVRTGTAATSNTYPYMLSELAIPITTGSRNSCGVAYAGATLTSVSTRWTTNGPFVSFYVPTTGFRTPIGTLRDTLTRSSASGTAGTLTITISSVDSSDAVELDKVVDGGDGATKGRVQYTSGVTPTTVSYIVPVGRNC